MHVDPTTARDPLQRTPRGFTSLHDRNDAMQRLRLAVDQTCRLITHQLERCPDQHIHHLSMQLPSHTILAKGSLQAHEPVACIAGGGEWHVSP
jgi:hypothetical protein